MGVVVGCGDATGIVIMKSYNPIATGSVKLNNVIPSETDGFFFFSHPQRKRSELQ